MNILCRRLVGAVLVLAAVGLAVTAVRHGFPRARASATHDVYYCPMHPGYTSDRPGNCPICSMTLVKRDPSPPLTRSLSPEGRGSGVRDERMKGEGVADHVSIHLTPEKRQLIGVKTAPARRGPMTKTIRTVGTVAYDPALYQAEAEYLQAIRGLQRAQETATPEAAEPAARLVESARLRLQVLGLPAAFLDEMAAWEGPDRRLLLADPGGRVWVYATIYEYELPWVTPGQTVTIEVPAAPGKTFEGPVRAVDPILDAATRSARVRVALTDSDGVLKPGMFVNASLRVTRDDRLTIPASAVMATGIRSLVFVAKEDGVLEPRDVTLGVRADDAVEIISGVAEGESVVTSGNFLVDSESRLKAAVEGVAGGGHQHGS